MNTAASSDKWVSCWVRHRTIWGWHQFKQLVKSLHQYKYQSQFKKRTVGAEFPRVEREIRETVFIVLIYRGLVTRNFKLAKNKLIKTGIRWQKYGKKNYNDGKCVPKDHILPEHRILISFTEIQCIMNLKFQITSGYVRSFSLLANTAITLHNQISRNKQVLGTPWD